MNTRLSLAALLSAAILTAAPLTGCRPVNSLYKKDTGEMPVVGAPQPVFIPVAVPDDPAAGGAGVAADPDAEPEVLTGEAPAEIQPLDEAAVETEFLEDYVVVKGDYFGKISQKVYGTSKRAKDLIAANPDVDPKKMQIGDIIRVPR